MDKLGNKGDHGTEVVGLRRGREELIKSLAIATAEEAAAEERRKNTLASGSSGSPGEQPAFAGV